MLSPPELGLGYIGAATSLTLVLPVDRYDYCFLVATAGEEPTAIFLDERYQFQAFGCLGNTSYKGLLIPDVRIEVDETLIFDAAGRWAVPGMIGPGNFARPATKWINKVSWKRRRKSLFLAYSRHRN